MTRSWIESKERVGQGEVDVAKAVNNAMKMPCLVAKTKSFSVIPEHQDFINEVLMALENANV